MTICEYFFKGFYSRGTDDYLQAWVAEIDLMADQGWKVLDCRRQLFPGFWTVILGRPACEFPNEEPYWTEESDIN